MTSRVARVQAVARTVVVASGFGGMWIASALGQAGAVVAVVATAASCVDGRPRLPARAWIVVQLVFLAWLGVSGLALDRHVLDLFGQLLVFVQVHRLLTRRGPRDDLYAMFLALGQLLLAAVLTVELGFLVVFVVFAFAVAIALPLTRALIAAEDAWAREAGQGSVHWSLRSRPPPEADAPLDPLARAPALAALVGLALLLEVATAALFVVLPRTQAAFLGGALLPPVPVSGFSDRVRLGSVGTMQLSDEPVFRATLSTADGSPYLAGASLYWHGLALDRFDGRGWELSEPARTPIVARGGGQSRPPPRSRPWTLREDVVLEPLETPTLFHVAEAAGIYGDPKRMDAADTEGYTVPTPRQRLRYTVYSQPRTRQAADLRGRDPRSAAPDLLLRHTQLPADLDPRLPALAEDWTRGAVETLDEVLLVQSRLRGPEFAYSLDQPASGRDDPLAAFLLDLREGHCEYFATGMAVLLRARGIPTRVVNGFLGGEWNPIGEYWLVRQRDAHSWVEVWFPGDGWVVFDPTPSTTGATSGEARISLLGRLRLGADYLSVRWQSVVLEYGLDQQADAVRSALAGLSALPDRAMSFAPRGPERPRAELGRLVPALLIVVVVGLGLMLVRAPGRQERARRLVRGLVAVWSRAAATAEAPPPDASNQAWARWAGQAFPETMADAERSVAAYEASRFGERTLPEPVLRALGALLRRAKKLPTRNRRPTTARRTGPHR